jgi:hypothetical protein
MTNKQMNKPTSRRDWFKAPAALLGAAAISSVRAQAQATPQTINDISVMNFALRVEYLQSAFYQKGLAMFKPADFQNSVTSQTIGGTKIGANIYSYLTAIAQSEQDHINTLIQTIYSLDGPPQVTDCYNFGFTTADSFLQMAQTIENLGVSAYNGAIITQFETSNSTVNNPGVQALMATIGSVQARHAAYFNLLNLTLPFPTPLDTPQTMAQVLAAMNPYLTTGCNAPPIPLTLAVAGPAKDSIITTNQATVPLSASLSTSATGQPLSFLWQQVLGSPLLEIINDSSETATAILMGGAAEYSIALRVTDSLGNSDQDTMKIIYQP